MAAADTLYGSNASVLITGASSGIGAAIAEHLAPHGGRIALMARGVDGVHRVAEAVRAAGGVPLEVVGDVTDPAAVTAARERIDAEQGPVDVAFLNAGVGWVTPLRKFDAGKVKRVFEVNVLGVVHWLGELLPAMIERRSGVVVGVSSLAAHQAWAGLGAYSASKAALSRLLASLRLEAVDFGIQISVAEPGFVRTPATAKARFPMPFILEADETARRICRGVAAGEGVIRFPWQMAAALQVMNHLPPALIERVGPMMRKRKRERR